MQERGHVPGVKPGERGTGMGNMGRKKESLELNLERDVVSGKEPGGAELRPTF